jgi:hypothetical protein
MGALPRSLGDLLCIVAVSLVYLPLGWSYTAAEPDFLLGGAEMERHWVRVVGGLVLVVVGVLALLQNQGIVAADSGLLWAFLFGAGAIFFVGFYLADRAVWWPLIPAGTMIGLAGVIGLSLLDESAAGLGGAVFLACSGIPFALIYLTNHEHWWAIIPAGALVTLAVVAGLSEPLGGDAAGGIFFLGLAVTFWLLSLVARPAGRLRWALVPAAALAVLGVLVLAHTPEAIGYIAAVAMMLAGIWLVWGALRHRRSA